MYAAFMSYGCGRCGRDLTPIEVEKDFRDFNRTRLCTRCRNHHRLKVLIGLIVAAIIITSFARCDRNRWVNSPGGLKSATARL
jgi:DNA-directed RNA polymerase subunit RPC12/RpoP